MITAITIRLTSGRQIPTNMDDQELADALNKLRDPSAVLRVSLSAVDHFIPTRHIEDITKSK